MERLLKVRLGWRWGVAVAVALVVTLAVAHDSGPDARAGSPVYGADGGRIATGPPVLSPDFNLALFSGGVIKDGCDNLFNDKKCVIHPGSKFRVQVFLDSIDGLPDTNTNTIAGYLAFGISLHYSPGLTRQDLPNECAPWIDKDIQAFEQDFGTPGDNRFYNMSCFTDGSESTDVGFEVAEVEFACPPFKSKEYITIVHGDDGTVPFDTGLAADDLATIVPESGASETIIINCDNDFVWDIDESGQVSITDVFQVVQHFGEVKPTP